MMAHTSPGDWLASIARSAGAIECYKHMHKEIRNMCTMKWHNSLKAVEFFELKKNFQTHLLSKHGENVIKIAIHKVEKNRNNSDPK